MSINKWFKICLFVLICFIKLTSYAIESKKNLVVALTSQFPPYTIDRVDKTGIDPELISRVLERAGYDTSFIPTNSKRINAASTQNSIDAVAGWVKDFLPNCHVTKPYRYWLNALIVPQSSNIESINDLAGKRISKFEGAENFIENFDVYTKDAKLMIVSDSSVQAGRMIRANRIDAYIGDYVGYYYALVMTYGEEVANELTSVKHFFNRNTQRICFKDEEIRDAFDATLDIMIDEGIYESVYSKYSPNVGAENYPGKDR